MSEQDESGERTELPTEKRRREAREQGNIPRSRELATAAVFGAGVLAIIAMGPGLARALYREGQLGREIPVRLYAAVAQILSYVYQLRAWRVGEAPLPDLPAVDVDEHGGKA